MKPKIHLKFTKPDGRTVEVKTTQPPTEEMFAEAERLADLVSMGACEPHPHERWMRKHLLELLDDAEGQCGEISTPLANAIRSIANLEDYRGK